MDKGRCSSFFSDCILVETFVWKRATTSGTPPSPRDSHTCSSWKNKFIVIGGEDAHDYYLSDVHVLDTGHIYSRIPSLVANEKNCSFLQNLVVPSSRTVIYTLYVLINNYILGIYFIRYANLEGAEHFRPSVASPSWSCNCCFWQKLVCFWGIY